MNDLNAEAITNTAEWESVVAYLTTQAQQYLELAAEAPDLATQHYYRGCWHTCKAMIRLPDELFHVKQSPLRESPRIQEIPRGY